MKNGQSVGAFNLPATRLNICHHGLCQPDADLDVIKNIVLEEIDALASAHPPTDIEL